MQHEIDQRCFAAYGIGEADRLAFTEQAFAENAELVEGRSLENVDDTTIEDEVEGERSADPASLAAELISWAVGTAFGRFDVRIATGARSLPPEPGPFDALPQVSPGALADEDGLPSYTPPFGYPLDVPRTGILTNDPGHARDLSTGVRRLFELVFGEDAEPWWKEVSALVDPRGHNLQTWLAANFLDYHLKSHSKNRRKAPIYWQLATPSASYSVWLYIHAFNKDTLYHVQNDYVTPKLAHEERRLESLRSEYGASLTSAQRKDLAAQETLVEELRAMLDEVKRVAPLWNPDLDDGVMINFAPLWRLVPQLRPWQKELKATWDALCSEEYDWAHLAIHLWPERVVPKCATDRSLAIAHGLEDVFWFEDAGGKWKPRKTPLRPVDELIRERSSAAVKAALDSLLQASAATGNGRRPARRGRSRGGES